MVYITADLLNVLLEEAGNHEPHSVTIELAVTRAGEFDDLDLPPDTPVFTTFYFPGASRSVEAVFGSNLGTPAGESPGLFISHPDGTLDLEQTDNFREIVLVAVPPWDLESVAVFSRNGQRQTLDIIDSVPPEESLP